VAHQEATTAVEKIEEVKFYNYSFVVEKRHRSGDVFCFLKIINYERIRYFKKT